MQYLQVGFCPWIENPNGGNMETKIIGSNLQLASLML